MTKIVIDFGKVYDFIIWNPVMSYFMRLAILAAIIGLFNRLSGVKLTKEAKDAIMFAWLAYPLSVSMLVMFSVGWLCYISIATFGNITHKIVNRILFS